MFFWGLKDFRFHRKIKNIPTSKISSLAVGLVEVYGKSVYSSDLVDPIDSIPCAHYSILVEILGFLPLGGKSGKEGSLPNILHLSGKSGERSS